MLQGPPELVYMAARSPERVRGEVVQDVLQRGLRAVPKEGIPSAAGQGSLALGAHNEVLALIPALWRHTCPICMIPKGVIRSAHKLVPSEALSAESCCLRGLVW